MLVCAYRREVKNWIEAYRVPTSVDSGDDLPDAEVGHGSHAVAVEVQGSCTDGEELCRSLSKY